MLRDSIPGMNKIIDNDPPPRSVILVTGSAGTLKSTFVLSVMNLYLEQHLEDTAVYTTMEEHKESLFQSMQSAGIRLNEHLIIRDIGTFMIDLHTQEKKSDFKPRDYIELVDIGLSMMNSKDDQKPLHCFALDSINAFWYASQIDGEATRQKILELFHRLRNSAIYSFIISESPPLSNASEYSLADCIIELGTINTKSRIKRYIQVKKMKAVRHSLEPFIIDITKNNGLSIIGQLRP